MEAGPRCGDPSPGEHGLRPGQRQQSRDTDQARLSFVDKRSLDVYFPGHEASEHSSCDKCYEVNRRVSFCGKGKKS